MSPEQKAFWNRVAEPNQGLDLEAMAKQQGVRVRDHDRLLQQETEDYLEGLRAGEMVAKQKSDKEAFNKGLDEGMQIGFFVGAFAAVMVIGLLWKGDRL